MARGGYSGHGKGNIVHRILTQAGADTDDFATQVGSDAFRAA